MKRRLGLMAAASWSLATVLTSVVVWRAVAVLDNGSQVEVLDAAQVAEKLVTATMSPSATPTPSAAPSDSPTTDASSEPSDDASPSDEPSQSPTATSTKSFVTPTRTPTSTPTQTAQQVVRVWTVTGGVVSAACTGDAISLVYATPQDGWRIEIESRGPQKIQVELSRNDQGTKLVATCVGGIPQETTTSGHD